ncbi:MAG TPA: trehalose-phosphatase [Candidatus Acidoferrum sp.]|nr:trehalose-phosphatase [Candidatus Acidoferrum sp.]
MTKPRHLFSVWDEFHLITRGYSRCALFLDFDGTLAPIRARPESVWLAPRVRRALQGIVRDGTLVAIISGRGLDDLRRRVGLRGIWYAGAHGYFLLSPNGRRYSLLSKKKSAQMRAILRVLRARLRGLRRIQVDPKDATIAIHYRRANQTQTWRAREIVEELAASSKDLRLMHGKSVWEILPATRVDKWTAVRFILHKQPRARGRTLLFYLGDDTTDEAVFRKMKGISVAIGKQEGTAAKYLLRSPSEVNAFLDRWPKLVR